MQLPDASSIDRTDAVLDRMSAIALKTPGIEGTFAITGLNLLSGTNQSNTAAMFLPLKPFAERNGKPKQSAKHLTAYLSEKYSHIQEGFSLVLMPPPVQGIGQAGRIQDAGRGSLGPRDAAAIAGGHRIS